VEGEEEKEEGEEEEEEEDSSLDDTLSISIITKCKIFFCYFRKIKKSRIK
jgi:hypothetical protein